MRIVSVCPSNTDLCAHLGLLNFVVGRDSWSDWPEQGVRDIPIVGSVLDIKVDRVQSLKPDLILASLNVPGMEKVVPELQKTGIPTHIFDPECWEDVIRDVSRLGELLGYSDRATSAIHQAEARIDRLKTISGESPRLKLFIEWWPDPIITPFAKSYVNQVLDWLNLDNPFAGTGGRSGVVTQSQIVEASPDLYAISWCGTKWKDYRIGSVYERFASSGLDCLRFERVFALWEGIIGHPSLRLLDGAERILNFRQQVGI